MTDRTRRWLLIPACSILIGCAGLQDGTNSASPGRKGSTEEASTLPPGDVPPPDWDNPIGGAEVSSVAKAAQDLDFAPYVPKGLGGPDKILVDAGVGVAFVYNTERFGGVMILEQTEPVPPAEYQEWMQSVVDNVKLGTAEIVNVRGGTHALVIVPETPGHGASISWLTEGREIVIRGPRLQRADVLQLAETI